MKKLFAILAIASIAFVSCNSSSDAEATTEDTTTVAPEAAPSVDTVAAPMADTTMGADTSAH